MNLRRLAPLIAVGALACAGSTASAGPVAHAAYACPTPHYPGSGYFTSLHVSGTSCSRGGQVAVDYYHCRIRHGGRAGTCPGGVDGYRCSEKRQSISTEIDARVSCHKGHAVINHSYQQFT
jgi:hypothetical protein